MLYCRDEEEHISKVLDSLFNQSVPFDEVILVDDASIDKTLHIAHNYGCNVVKLTDRHPSYIGLAQLANIVNKGVEEIYKYSNVDFWMNTCGDIVLEKNYNEILLSKFEDNPNLVVGGGTIEGEHSFETHPRGAGRFYLFSYWDKYVKRYPVLFTWESYPVYKALSLGFETRSFKKPVMYALRESRTVKGFYKWNYGVAMREFGFFPPYAIGRCLFAILHDHKIGFYMLKGYIFFHRETYDPYIRKWFSERQRLNLFKSFLRKIKLLDS